MHIPALNITELLLGLFRGTLDCEHTDSKRLWDWAVLQGDIWKTHGLDVAACTPHLPGSFDRPPRNPAEKINTSYKAWEYLLYIYGLGPGLFYGVLPDRYWKNTCKLVAAVRILLQHSITSEQLRKAQQLIIDFSEEFELLYYQRRTDRIHFIRHSLHSLAHGAAETVRVGPTAIYSQWTIERTIGNLGEELRQHSNPYQNITQRAIFRAQTNALAVMIPSLLPSVSAFPRGSRDLGEGYVLLTKTDTCPRDPTEGESAALRVFMKERFNRTYQRWEIQPLVRWARLRLPNGQIARSAWRETLKSLENLRISRNVKEPISRETSCRFAEVLYYFVVTFEGASETVAMVSLFTKPDQQLFEDSCGTVLSCMLMGETSLRVVNVKSIQSVVAAIPFPHNDNYPELEGNVFIVEKPGLDIATISDFEEALYDE
ncbi:hypothetical protein BDQ17DRAFT_1255007 [Cyathus striatus]|nr:hypothetical protein BDQ17DRAFT_1255007 [Cyathus striatus]